MNITIIYIAVFIVDVFFHNQVDYARKQHLWEDELAACVAPSSLPQKRYLVQNVFTKHSD
jgi:hypothetical protein